jgi:integrase
MVASEAVVEIVGRRQKLVGATVLIADLYNLVEEDYLNNNLKSHRNLGTWKRHIEKHFGAQPAREFDPDLVQSYIRKRQQAGAKPGTINRELALIKRGAALGLELLKTDDDKLIAALTRWSKVKALKERNARSGFVKDAEYEALARETAAIAPWLRCLFELAYNYGFRKSELLGLRVKQIDLEERTIKLNAGETKNDDAREIDILPHLFELVRQMIEGKKPDEYVFTRPGRAGSLQRNSAGLSPYWYIRYRDEQGRELRESTNTTDEVQAREMLRAKDHPLPGRRIAGFRDEWAQACERAGVPGLLFHDLRRSAVRNLRRQGIPEKVAMKISGHRTRATFDRYDVVDRSDVKLAFSKMSQAAAKLNGIPLDLTNCPFIQLVKLAQPQSCAEPGCNQEAPVAIEVSGSAPQPFCRGHAVVKYALWASNI